MPSRKAIETLRAQIADIESGLRPVSYDALEHVPCPEGAAAAEREAGPGNSPQISGKDGDAREALNKIVALVNVRERSERAVRDRLAREGFSQAGIDEAVCRAKDYGFIDDSRFADILIRSRVAQGKGCAGIERELSENGIDVIALDDWPDGYGIDRNGEVERAMALLDRKPPRSKNLRDGAYRKLVQRGFSSTVASSAARQWIERLQGR